MFLLLLIILVLVIILMSIDPVREFIIPRVVSNPLIYDEAYKSRSAFIHDYIGEFLPQPPCTILNFGCGLNLYSDYLVDSGYEVIALDINDVSVSKKVKPVIYNGEKIPENLHFDCIIITTVLHHIPEPICINILEQIKTYNKQVIILEDNNVSFLTPLWCMFTNLQFLNHPLNFKTCHEWKELLSKYFRIKNLKVDSDACVFNLFPLKDNIYVK